MIQAEQIKELQYFRDLWLFRQLKIEAKEVLDQDFSRFQTSKIIEDYKICARSIQRRYPDRLARKLTRARARRMLDVLM